MIATICFALAAFCYAGSFLVEANSSAFAHPANALEAVLLLCFIGTAGMVVGIGAMVISKRRRGLSMVLGCVAMLLGVLTLVRWGR